jgi:hypothetical protein
VGIKVVYLNTLHSRQSQTLHSVRQDVRMSMDRKDRGVFGETVVAYFKIVSSHSHDRTEERYETLQLICT